MSGLRPWEPEETVGRLWHHLVGTRDDELTFPEVRVTLEDMRTRMGILLRGMGGNRSVDIRNQTSHPSKHRRSLLRQIGHSGESALSATFDGENLDVQPDIAAFKTRADNEGAYLWLAAWAACDEPGAEMYADPLRADLEKLRSVYLQIGRVFARAPGLENVMARLGPELLSNRRTARLPALEAQVEMLVRRLLGEQRDFADEAEVLWQIVCGSPLETCAKPAPKGYKNFKPVLLWPDRRLAPAINLTSDAEHADGGKGTSEGAERKRAQRRKSDQANRRDSLILHRFETIKSWADVMNLNRKVEDDDESNARKAGSDTDELNLAAVDNKPATRLSFDLDLSPQDIDRESLATGTRLPEWNHRTGAYLKDHVRILELAAEGDLTQTLAHDPLRQRRIMAIRRQFEALMPRRTMQAGEDEGDDIDTDAAVRYLCDRAAGQSGSPRIFRKLTGQTRDLSVATLVDTSRSTESIVDGRPVIDVARESLLALGHGLNATGDSHAMYGFSSLKRDRVFLAPIKGFDEPMGPDIEARIAAVKPGFYTRLGAAVRFVTGELKKRGSSRRLMLIITDGKPNDLDYYEGRYGIEDTRKAVVEARLAGLAVFAIAIDRKAESYIPHIFGQNGYAIVSHPARLAEAMPQIFRHLVS